MKEQTGVCVMEGLTSKHLCFSLVCNQAGGEVVTFWSKECISRGGEEHGDGRLDVDGAYLMGEKSLLHKACRVVGYHVDARYAEMKKDKLMVYVLT
ncbi:hypothetical protein F2Q69_00033290 [Brassica cretica]|uniref:Uncharacterized protein n=1 Tax=Brassica cretica TaxID=69181 RepID=A0A8S9SQK5_BRACR|nr:hypothetical protein F2Q69_00033290 [Brassica cretica]